MKIKIIGLLLIIPFFLFAQQKGATPISNSPTTNIQTTRAVVIGISDYQEPLIPDLKYADRDAEAFAAWLRSPAGGNIPEANIFLHTNETATNAQMIMSLDWLIEESQAGDRAFIYFSGHGDVERVTKFNNGYLLGYDSPPAVYGAGAFAVNYLKDIIATLSDNGVQVFLITDACRAGKLAGSNANGTQVTATRMSQQFANEIKILSCQPDEFSIEGEQWGGGRGCFSFHLENALYGFADKNEDAEINLMELRNYLENNVSAEADPNSQFPIVEGPAKEKITLVDAIAFAEKQQELKNKKTEFLAIDNKGVEELILAEADTNIQKIYEQFLTAIDSNNLMAPEGKSANDYYEILIANNDIKKLHGTVKRKFVVALMDEGQQIINRIMDTDQMFIDDIYGKKTTPMHLANYYRKASEILGKDHYAFSGIKAKELYFESKKFISENFPDLMPSELNEQKFKVLNKALQYDSLLALIHFDMAYYLKYKDPQKTTYYERARRIAPEWVLINANLGYEYISANPQKSYDYLNKAIALDSSYLHSYKYLGSTYYSLDKPDSAQITFELYINKFEEKLKKAPSKVTTHDFSNAGIILTLIFKDYSKAKKYLETGAKKSNNKNKSLLWHLALTQQELFEFENAIKTYQNTLKAGLEEYIINYQSGSISFYFLGDLASAKNYFSQSEKFFNNFLECLFYAGQHKKMLETYKKRQDEVSLDFYTSYLLGEAARLEGQEQNAKKQFKTLIDSISVTYPIRINPSLPDFMFKALAYYKLEGVKSFDKFISEVQHRVENEENIDFNYYFILASIYAQTRNIKKAIQAMQNAKDSGWEPHHLNIFRYSLCSPLLDPIRETPEYYEFVKEHYPYYLEVATKIPYKK